MLRTDQFLNTHVWNDAQCEQIMEAVYEVLEKTGCCVKSPVACRLLADNGCTVNGNRVKIPRGILQSAIASAPKAFTIYDREGNPAMKLDMNHTYFGPPISTVYVRDGLTLEKRKGQRIDAYRAGQVCDALENCDWASAMSGISDGVSSLSDVYEVYELLKSTTKPVMYWASNMDNLKTEFEMFEACAGGRQAVDEKPFTICLICPMDPLVHNEDSMEQIMYLAERNAATVYISGVSMGCTSPITIAGNVVIGIADTLVGLLVSQLVRKGAPFIVSKFCNTMDMRTMTIEDGHPEMLLSHMASCDVFRHLGIPFAINLGDTDSGTFDQPAAFNTAVSLYSAVLAGATMVMSMGGFEKCLTSYYVGTVYGNEVINYLKALMGGAEISSETLLLDEIDSVGPGGNFLMEESTADYLHEKWQPDIFANHTLEETKAPEYVPIEEKYQIRVREIIQSAPKKPLSEDVMARLNVIMERAEEKAGKA